MDISSADNDSHDPLWELPSRQQIDSSSARKKRGRSKKRLLPEDIPILDCIVKIPKLDPSLFDTGSLEHSSDPEINEDHEDKSETIVPSEIDEGNSSQKQQIEIQYNFAVEPTSAVETLLPAFAESAAQSTSAVTEHLEDTTPTRESIEESTFHTAPGQESCLTTEAQVFPTPINPRIDEPIEDYSQSAVMSTLFDPSGAGNFNTPAVVVQQNPQIIPENPPIQTEETKISPMEKRDESIEVFGSYFTTAAMFQNEDHHETLENIIPTIPTLLEENKSSLQQEMTSKPFEEEEVARSSELSELMSAEVFPEQQPQTQEKSDQVEEKIYTELQAMNKTNPDGDSLGLNQQKSPNDGIQLEIKQEPESKPADEDQHENLENVMPNQIKVSLQPTRKTFPARKRINNRPRPKKPFGNRGNWKQLLIYPQYKSARKSREEFANLKLIPVELHPFPQPLPEEDPEDSLTSEQKDENVKKFEAFFKLECDLCHEKFQFLKDFRKHWFQVHKRRFYIICCDLKIHGIHKGLEHIEFHKNPELFKCEKCEKVFQTRERLHMHKTHQHVSPDMHRFKCPKCGQTFPFLKDFTIHSHIHFSPEELAFSCIQCYKIFENEPQLQEHVSKTHMRQEEDVKKEENTLEGGANTCNHCGKRFSIKHRLDRHIKLVHEYKKYFAGEFPCSYCGKIFKNSYHRSRHILMVHKGQKPSSTNVLDTHGGVQRVEKRPRGRPQLPDSQSSGIHCCPYCPKRYTQKHNVKRHIDNVHEFSKDQLFNCSHCSNSYKNKYIYRRHLMRVHQYTREDAEKGLPRSIMKPKVEQQSGQPHRVLQSLLECACSRCGKVFKNDYQLKTHIRYTHDEPRIFKCTHCNKIYRDKRSYRKHVQDCCHEGPKEGEQVPQVLKCSLCNKIYSDISRYKEHIESHSSEQQNIVKQEQPQQPEQSGLVQQSEELSAGPSQKPIKKHHCTRCGKYFSTKYNLQNHITKIHNFKQEYYYTCPICGRRQKDKANHMKHMDLHKVQQRTETLTCSFCQKVMSNSWSLKRHIVAFHKNETLILPYSCSLCMQAFNDADLLKNHVQTFHNSLQNEPPPPPQPEDENQKIVRKSFQCTKCPKVFSMKHYLQQHLERHTNIKIKCPLCPKVSPNKPALNCHIYAVHKRHFKCSICNATFLTAALLNSHTNATHTISSTGQQEQQQVKKEEEVSTIENQEYRQPVESTSTMVEPNEAAVEVNQSDELLDEEGETTILSFQVNA